jgi:hypothetical protein
VELSGRFHIGHAERPERPDPLRAPSGPLTRAPAPPPCTPAKTPYLGDVKAGLCDSCRHQKLVRTTRGGVFSLCERSKSDPRYAKYPRLPVERCPGWERRSGSDPGPD